MVKASTDGRHTDSLDSWHCPGCKATENVKRPAPTIKKPAQPHLVKKWDSVSPARARLIDKTRGGVQALPAQAKANNPINKPTRDATPARKRVKQSHHPSASLENEKEKTRPLPLHNEPPSTNVLLQQSPPLKNQESSSEPVFTANADISLMVQPSSSKMLLVDNNDVHLVKPSRNPIVQVQSKLHIIPSQVTLLPVNLHISPELSSATAKVREIDLTLPPPYENKDPDIEPLPPSLDLRRILKRKRPHMPTVFQPNLRHQHVSPVDDGDGLTDESPLKRRRLNRNRHPALRIVRLVAGSSFSSSNSLHAKDQAQTATTPLPDISLGPLPSDLIVHGQDKLHKDVNDKDVPEDTRIQGAISGDNIAIAVTEARLVEASPDIEGAATHSEGRGSSHTDVTATFSKETSPIHDGEVVDIMKTAAAKALQSGLPSSPPLPLPLPETRTAQDETSDDSSLERSEVDQCLSKPVADNNSQDGLEPISNEDAFGAGVQTAEEISPTDGPLSSSQSDDGSGSGHQSLEIEIDKDVAEEEPAESRQHELDPTGISDCADQIMWKDKVPDAAPPQDPGNAGDKEKKKKKESLQLDAIAQRLPQLKSRRSYKLPKVTLPALATCFGPFKASSKRVGVGL